ncbi:MAG: DUF3047 domain-containing protein [Pseudomonadota bacterium]|nr:DUF3047 domain-containing protein [Pseudomonadota bacterium]
MLLAHLFPESSALAGGWRLGNEQDLPLELRQRGWRVLANRDHEPTRFLWRENGVVQVDTDDSVGFLFRELSADERRAHSMSWRWQVARDLPPADLSRRDADDRPLAVHLWFDLPETQTSWWTETGRSIFRWTGLPVPGRTITYVWGGKHDSGASFPSPYRPRDGRVIVLRPSGSPVNTWQDERIEPDADYVKYFGAPAVAPRFVVISGDSDNRGGTSSGLVTLPVFR